MSPAKRFHTIERLYVQPTHAHFIQQADQLVEKLKHHDASQLRSMMSISDAIANLNVERFNSYQPNAPQTGFPAALMFAGDAYQSLDFQSLSDTDIHYAQETLLLLSGLYGLLRPLDLIQPYRLEMGCNTRTTIGNTLYELWRKPISEHLNQKIHEHHYQYHLNIASSEYSKAIDTTMLTIPTIDLVFAQAHNDTYKVVGIKAKRARGAMARFVIQNKPQSLDDIKRFNHGYEFSQAHSSNHRYVFIADH